MSVQTVSNSPGSRLTGDNNICTEHHEAQIASLIRRVESLENTEKRNTKRFRPFSFWLLWIAVFLSVAAVCITTIPNSLIVDSQNIILAFIGVLATFVVVGNYAQVLQVKADFEKKTRDMMSSVLEVTKTDLMITRKELSAPILIEISQSFAQGNTYEMQLYANIRAVSIFDELITFYNKTEWIDSKDRTFSIIGILLDTIEEKKGGLSVTIPPERTNELLGFLDNVKDRRKDRVYNFLVRQKNNL